MTSGSRIAHAPLAKLCDAMTSSVYRFAYSLDGEFADPAYVPDEDLSKHTGTGTQDEAASEFVCFLDFLDLSSPI